MTRRPRPDLLALLALVMVVAPPTAQAKTGRFQNGSGTPWRPAVRAQTPVLHTMNVSEPTVWDQGGFITNNSEDISTQVVANDFVVSQQVSLTRFDVWLTDSVANNNGVLDDFSGTLGWAIYSDSAGKPGTIVASGQDPATVVTDTGQQDAFNSDIAKVSGVFSPPVNLSPGTYWLALHENAWGSAYDGSTIWWQQTSPNVGAAPVGDSNVSSPSAWDATLDNAEDLAFILYGTFENVPALSSVGLGLAALLVLGTGFWLVKRTLL